jgi:DNA ligase (NAD+)
LQCSPKRSTNIRIAIASFDAPVVSDGEYDALMRDLQHIEEQYPALRTPDSPTQRVGFAYSQLFTPVTHAERMMSLDNAFDDAEFDAWAERVERVDRDAASLPSTAAS